MGDLEQSPVRSGACPLDQRNLEAQKFGAWATRWLPRLCLTSSALGALDIAAASLGLHSAWTGVAFLLALTCVFLVVCGAFIGEIHEGVIESGTNAFPIRWRILAACVLILSLLSFAVRFVHRPEPALGNEDQGIYCLSAVNLARTGSYCVSAPILADAPPWAPNLFTTPSRAEALRGDATAPQGNLAYFGFFQDSKHPQTLNPTFPPGFPVFLADLYLLGGWPALGWANALLVGALAASAGLLVRRWFGLAAGVCTLLVLLANPLAVWSANVLYAEPLLAWFWLLSLLCLSNAGSEGRRSSLMAVGAFMGLGMLIKIDGLPMVLCAILVAAGWWWQGCRRAAATLAVSTGVAFAFSVLVLWTFNGLYFAGSLHALLQLAGSTRTLTAFLLASLVITGAWFGFRRRQAVLVIGLRLGAILLLLALATYAHFVRPYSESPDQFFYWPQNRMIPSLREQTFLRLGWYVGDVGLIAMLCGLSGLIWRMRSAAVCAFVALGIGTGAFLCFDLYNNPVQPYAMRRLMVFAVPALSVAIALWWLPFMRLDRWWKVILACAGVAVPLLAMHRVDVQLVQRANYGGLVAQMDALADLLPARAVILLGRNDPCCLLAPYLHLAKGKDVVLYTVPLDAGAQLAWRQVMATWRRSERRIFHVALRFDLPIAPRAEVLGAQRGILDYWTLPNLADRLPTGPERVVREYQVSEIR